MTKIAHLSDIHFGRIAYPEIVDALVADINASQADLVVISGDLTQRARPPQFEAAVAMIDAFEAAVLVVPGNHDVYAWWHRPLLRLFNPLRRYRRLVTDDLTPTYEADGVAVLGINSAHGWTIKGGRISSEMRERMVAFFSKKGADDCKILVLHHHLFRLEALGRHDISRQARKTLVAASRARVDLILCGHLHVSHIEVVEVVPGRPIVIASAGTATSLRWREPHIGLNDYNVIDIMQDEMIIEERRYDASSHRYEQVRSSTFERVK